MGYANPSQISNGIHFRQRSRAFIFHDKQNKSRIVFVSIDACMVDQIVKLEVRNDTHFDRYRCMKSMTLVSLKPQHCIITIDRI